MTKAKVALVTGGARRVGAATAEELHSAGFTLAVHCNRSRADADALVTRLNERRSESAFTLQGDLLEEGACERLAQDMLQRAGRLDCLVNNASTFYPTAVGEITEDDWQSLVGSNLKAPVFLSQALAPALRKSRGVIVNMVDIHARIPNVREMVRNLSGGQRQAVAVGRALIRGGEIIIMDEPTAALGVEQTQEVLQLIDTLRAQGKTIILISHNIQQVFEIADYISVMFHGDLLGTRSRDDATEAEVVAMIMGKRSP